MIRPFKITDSERCAEIINACHKSMPELSDEQVRFLLGKYTPKYLEEEYLKHYVLVYEENDEILGVGSFITEGAEIRGIYIDPKFQSKGIGSRLVLELEKEAKMQGAQKVYVKAYFAPEHFYEKLGFKRMNEGETLRGNVRFRFVNMEKCLWGCVCQKICNSNPLLVN